MKKTKVGKVRSGLGTAKTLVDKVKSGLGTAKTIVDKVKRNIPTPSPAEVTPASFI